MSGLAIAHCVLIVVFGLTVGLTFRAHGRPEDRWLLVYFCWLLGVDILRYATAAIPADASGIERVGLHLDQVGYLSTHFAFAWLCSRTFGARWLLYVAGGVSLGAAVILVTLHPLAGETRAALYTGQRLTLTLGNWTAALYAAMGPPRIQPELAHLAILLFLSVDSVVGALAYLDRIGIGVDGIAGSWEAVMAANMAVLVLCTVFYVVALVRGATATKTKLETTSK